MASNRLSIYAPAKAKTIARAQVTNLRIYCIGKETFKMLKLLYFYLYEIITTQHSRLKSTKTSQRDEPEPAPEPRKSTNKACKSEIEKSSLITYQYAICKLKCAKPFYYKNTQMNFLETSINGEK